MVKAKKQFPLLEYNVLKETLEDIPQMEHKVLLKTIYSGCARVGEIVRNRYQKEWKRFDFDSLTIKDKFLILNLKTEKTHLARKVPLSRIDDPSEEYFKKNEAWLTEDLIAFYSKDKQFNWDISTRRAQQIFQKYLPEYGSHIHYLRHWRATHLRQGVATGKPIPLDIIKKIGGWTSMKVPEQTYEHSIIEDFINLGD